MLGFKLIHFSKRGSWKDFISVLFNWSKIQIFLMLLKINSAQWLRDKPNTWSSADTLLHTVSYSNDRIKHTYRTLEHTHLGLLLLTKIIKFRVCIRKSKYIHVQDRRWNADKPSAALDPYIPTWLTTSPANHRPANFWFFFFFLHSKEIVKSGATSGPTDEHQLQIWSTHSLTLSSTNQNYLLG